MKKLFVTTLLFALSVFSLVGCGGKTERISSPAQEYTASSHQIFSAPYDKVWKATVDSLAESFWTLENIEKDSGILTLSCTFDNPVDWVDCGKMHHSAKFGVNNQDITYENASKYQRLLFVDGVYIAWMDRTVALVAKSNVVVKKTGNNTVKVSINTNYVLSLNYHEAFGTMRMPSTSHTMSFNNKGIGSFQVADSMICKSKNTLEQAILQGIAQKLNQ